VRQPTPPNFFLVGTGKAGTTSLHRYLSQHPQIYMSPVKEPCYFAPEIRPANLTPELQRHIRLQSRALPEHIRDGQPFQPFGWLAGDWDEYLRLFQEVRDETVIGESSAAYLWSETAAASIHQRIPGARIAMILRDPAERAFSQYLHQVAVGLTRAGFREHIAQCARGGHSQLGPLYPFLEIGLYYRQVQRFLDSFPREQIRIYWYEEDWRQPARLLADLFGFLGVDATFQPDTAARNLQRRAPRWTNAHYFLKKLRVWYPLRALVPPAFGPRLRALAFRPGKSLTMDPADRQFLVDYYRDDIRKLSSLVDRDLSSWLR
jgi:hypothetical protein